MTIRIDSHAASRARERGASEEEISLTLRVGVPVPAGHGRLAKARVFPFGREWLGRTYKDKRVEVIYLEEGDDIIVVTVYVFYGQWE